MWILFLERLDAELLNPGGRVRKQGLALVGWGWGPSGNARGSQGVVYGHGRVHTPGSLAKLHVARVLREAVSGTGELVFLLLDWAATVSVGRALRTLALFALVA